MKKIIILLFIVVFASCNNDEGDSINEPELSETQIDLVTGINLREIPDQIPIKLGNPNVYLNDQFVVYPNPSRQILSVQSIESISDVWIMPVTAEKIFQQFDFNTILNSEIYTEGQIEAKAKLRLLDQNSTSLTIVLEDLASGYHKVFVKINGKIYWDNIYIYGESFEIEDLINYWE